MIEGEFIFYVNPEIEEDMKPVNPSERDLLPGGITRQEYDTRMNRLNLEYAIASDELETRNADQIEENANWWRMSMQELSIEWLSHSKNFLSYTETLGR